MRGGVRGLVGVAAAAAVTVAVGVPGVANAASTNTWTAQSVPMPSGAMTAGMTGVSCTSTANCEAVLHADPATPTAARWDGSTWTIQDLTAGGGEFVYPESVSCSSAANCMAAGFASTTEYVVAYTDHWNGTTWRFSDVVDYTGSELSGVSCPAAKSCMTVGSIYTDDNNEPLAEKWNGTIWKNEPVPEPSGTGAGTLTAVSCVSATDCVAVGEAGLTGAPQILAYTLNGTAWTQQAVPAPAGVADPELTGISCVSAANCTAVGDSDVSGEGGNGVFAEHWNGSAWTAQDLPLPAGTVESALTSVSCVSSQCTAAGFFLPDTAKGYKGRRPLAESFNGTRWSVQATAAPNSHKFFASISCLTAHTCTAVGSTATSGAYRNQPMAEQEVPAAGSGTGR
jgi:hypothetical protein